MGPSFWHILLLLVIVMLVFGPNRISGLGKSLGQAIRGFKKGLTEDPEIDVTQGHRNEQIRQGEQDQTTASRKKETDHV